MSVVRALKTLPSLRGWGAPPSGGWSEDALRARVASGAGWALGAFEGARPVGLALATGVTPEAELDLIWVRPDVRGQGTGGALLEAIHRTLQDSGFEVVHLEVSTVNPARRLYARFGYRQVGLRPGYYGQGDDAVLMRLALGTPCAGGDAGATPRRHAG